MNMRAMSPKRAQGGFTLIEVLIAILVMAFGLLGFALLQTMSVRFTQSANYRTQSTNLAYEMLDQIRVNRVASAAYLGDYTATAAANCTPPATGAAVGAGDYRAAWQCRLGKMLGDNATANVSQVGNEIVVSITWGDSRWDPDNASLSMAARTRL